MATYTPVIGGTNGRAKKITGASAGAADTLYTVTNTAGEIDEVFMQAWNTDNAGAHKLTILLGGTTNPDDYLEINLPPEGGPVQILDGHRMNGGVVIKGFADTGNLVCVIVDVNRIAT